MKVITNRPILHGGSVATQIETTDLHARALLARGLIAVQPKAAPAQKAPKPKAK